LKAGDTKSRKWDYKSLIYLIFYYKRAEAKKVSIFFDIVGVEWRFDMGVFVTTSSVPNYKHTLREYNFGL